MVGTFGVLLLGPFMPRLMVRYGYRDSAWPALPESRPDLRCWFSIRASSWCFFARCLIGVALAGLWIASGAWLNHVAQNQRRGTLNGIYQMCYACGFVLGPNLILSDRN